MSRFLPSDLWFSIGLKLESAGDRIRFRAVCKSWMSLLPFRQPPWLVLAETQASDDEQEIVEAEAEVESTWLMVLGSSGEFIPTTPPPRAFVCLSDQQPFKIDLPELHKSRTVGCTDNWLITMYLDETLRMSNPFSRCQIHLPSPRTFENRHNLDRFEMTPESCRDTLVWKVILSPSPSPNGEGDWVAIALHDCTCSLAIARPEDTSWITVQHSYYTQDIIVYKQQLYAVSAAGELAFSDLHLPKLSFLTDTFKYDPLELDPFMKINAYYRHRYLVEWLGEILQVIKVIDQFCAPCGYKTNRFEVYKFDWTTMEFIELRSLGEHSLFLGYNTSVSVRASDYHGLVKKNCIYFTDDHRCGYRAMRIPGERDMGVFDLEDKSITPHYKGTSTSMYSPPVWMVPT